MSKDGRDERDVSGFDMRAVLINGLHAQYEALRERLVECEDLLSSYGVDEFGAFPCEVDRYFGRYGVEHKCEEG